MSRAGARICNFLIEPRGLVIPVSRGIKCYSSDFIGHLPVVCGTGNICLANPISFCVLRATKRCLNAIQELCPRFAFSSSAASRNIYIYLSKNVLMPKATWLSSSNYFKWKRYLLAKQLNTYPICMLRPPIQPVHPSIRGHEIFIVAMLGNQFVNFTIIILCLTLISVHYPHCPFS